MPVSITNERSANEYLGRLIDLQKTALGLTPTEQDVVWATGYRAVTDDLAHPRCLPAALALIHPDFYTFKGRSFEGSLPWETNSDFRAGISRMDQCQAAAYLGVQCIANRFPEIRGKCEADHRWPNSLGGPSLRENRILLCRFHNGMKSNDVTRFNWSVVPSWLRGYLGRIARLKSG